MTAFPFPGGDLPVPVVGLGSESGPGPRIPEALPVGATSFEALVCDALGASGPEAPVVGGGAAAVALVDPGWTVSRASIPGAEPRVSGVLSGAVEPVAPSVPPKAALAGSVARAGGIAPLDAAVAEGLGERLRSSRSIRGSGATPDEGLGRFARGADAVVGDSATDAESDAHPGRPDDHPGGRPSIGSEPLPAAGKSAPSWPIAQVMPPIAPDPRPGLAASSDVPSARFRASVAPAIDAADGTTPSPGATSIRQATPVPQGPADRPAAGDASESSIPAEGGASLERDLPALQPIQRPGIQRPSLGRVADPSPRLTRPGPVALVPVDRAVREDPAAGVRPESSSDEAGDGCAREVASPPLPAAPSLGVSGQGATPPSRPPDGAAGSSHSPVPPRTRPLSSAQEIPIPAAAVPASRLPGSPVEVSGPSGPSGLVDDLGSFEEAPGRSIRRGGVKLAQGPAVPEVPVEASLGATPSVSSVGLALQAVPSAPDATDEVAIPDTVLRSIDQGATSRKPAAEAVRGGSKPSAASRGGGPTLGSRQRSPGLSPRTPKPSSVDPWESSALEPSGLAPSSEIPSPAVPDRPAEVPGAGEWNRFPVPSDGVFADRAADRPPLGIPAAPWGASAGSLPAGDSTEVPNGSTEPAPAASFRGMPTQVPEPASRPHPGSRPVEVREASESTLVSRVLGPGFRRQIASESLSATVASGIGATELPGGSTPRPGKQDPVAGSMTEGFQPAESISTSPLPSEGGQTAHGYPELPGSLEAKIAYPPSDLGDTPPALESPGSVDRSAMDRSETPEKQGFHAKARPLPDEAVRRDGQAGNPAGMTSATSRLAMVNHPMPSVEPGMLPRRAETGTPPEEGTAAAVSGSLPEASHSAWMAVRPVEGTDPAPQRVESTAPRPATRLQELMTDEAMVMQRFRTGSMTAVLRPDPSSELRVELRRRSGGIEIRATVERGDSQAIAEGWSGLQQQLRSQGIELLSLERQPSTPQSRDASEPSGERASSQSGGRGRHQQSPQQATPWSPAGPGPSAARQQSTRSPSAPDNAHRRHLLESWA